MKKLFTLLLLPFMLNAWDWHPCGESPEEGELFLITPASYNFTWGQEPFSYKMARYSDSKKDYVSRGYWTLTDEEILELFNVDVPFNFIP